MREWLEIRKCRRRARSQNRAELTDAARSRHRLREGAAKLSTKVVSRKPTTFQSVSTRCFHRSNRGC